MKFSPDENKCTNEFYKIDETICLTAGDNIQLKCDCNIGRIAGGTRRPISYSFVLQEAAAKGINETLKGKK